MEKLELKHLAGYLPYGLKCLTGVYPILKEDLIWKILGLVIDKGTDLGFSVKAIRHDYTNVINIWPIKPILRPLSDLTKEIEVNGEKLIPIDYINKEYNWDYVKNNIRDIVIENDYSLIEFLPKIVVNKLEEWHFDIHGLIEKGLAIDINTLK